MTNPDDFFKDGYKEFVTEFVFSIYDDCYRIGKYMSTTLSGALQRVPDDRWGVQEFLNPDVCLHNGEFTYKLYTSFGTPDDAFAALAVARKDKSK